MAIISKRDISRLSEMHDAHCISIFIPTHRSGQEVIQQKDPIVLKNQLKDVSSKLESQGLSINEIKKILHPVDALLEDRDFWRHQSDGLAIFLTDDSFEEFRLPIQFEAFNYVSNEFYLKPLMPMLGGDGRFFILALELEDVNFYEGTRYSISDVYIDDLTPKRLEERVGFDYQEKFLQFRTQPAGEGRQTQAVFHGHGSGEADRKDEIEKYFRAINDGLMEMLFDEDPPLVVASLDYLLPIYKKVNRYKHLSDEHISGNPKDMDVLDLHAAAWDILKTHFDRERKDRIGLFKQLFTSDKTASDIRQIIPAALEGKVETLFLQNRSDVWGIYDPKTRSVELGRQDIAPNVSLLNMAAVYVFNQGGHVYLLKKDEMPNPDSIVNAIYRY